MKTAAKTNYTPQPGAEVLPGYELREKIGSGGFGEVWRASAPGGFDKAIKFVFGRVDESRASSELDALEQIRDLRHPFLISTERIEVVEGTLIIVLELAEGNLKELYDGYRQEGLQGIPADDLITFLTDASDALDFIWTAQSLQHLDIKPENLMLSGGRAKIGDFGLVKRISDDESTSLGGVTPLYAPPEVFDGRPTAFSDQYSLAIVYQELLTGQLPFRGRTAAQLAMQHAHHPPMLEPLPIATRPVIRRALAKNPDHRYPSCRAFIEALVEASRQRQVQIKTSASKRSPGVRALLVEKPSEIETSPSLALSQTRDRISQSCEVGSTQQLHSESGGQTRALPVDANNRTIASLPQPPFDLTNDASSIRPLIVLGIGETGIRAICRAKQEHRSESDDAQTSADLQLLALDTDENTIRSASNGAFGAMLSTDEILRIPLRTSHSYREKGRKRFANIARRWVFNVPRSMRTDGIRPYGRLAFVDHYSRIAAEIDRLIENLVKSILTEESRQNQSGIPREKHPAFLLVGSACGGTCSGLVNELGYLIRERANRRGLSHCQVKAAMSLEFARGDKLSDLHAGNALAFLSEYRQYEICNEGYKGDAAADIPPSKSPGPPFHQINFLQPTRIADEIDFDLTTQQFSDFIGLHVTSPGADFLRASASDAGGISMRQSHRRSIGICQASITCLVSPMVRSKYLCHELLGRWIGDNTERATIDRSNRDDIVTWTQRILGRCGKSPDEFVDWISEQLLDKLQLTESQLIANCARTAIGRALKHNADNASQALLDTLLSEIDRSFRNLVTSNNNGVRHSFADLVTKICQPLIEKSATSFTEWIHSLVDTMRIRLPGANFAVETCLGILADSERDAREGQQLLKSKLEACRKSISTELVLLMNKPPEPPPPVLEEGEEPPEPVDPMAQLSELLSTYTKYRLREACFRVAEKTYATTTKAIEPSQEWLTTLRQKLLQIQKGFVVRQASRERELNANSGLDRTDTSRLFEGGAEQILVKLDELLSLETLGKRSPLSSLVDAVGAEQQAFKRHCELAAIRLVEHAQPQQDVGLDLTDAGLDADGKNELSTTLGEAMTRIAPPDYLSGLSHRALCLTPGDSSKQMLARRIEEGVGVTPSIASHASVNVTFLWETYGVDLSRVAQFLYEGNDTRVELADRLRSRDDLA